MSLKKLLGLFSKEPLPKEPVRVEEPLPEVDTKVEAGGMVLVEDAPPHKFNFRNIADTQENYEAVYAEVWEHIFKFFGELDKELPKDINHNCAAMEAFTNVGIAIAASSGLPAESYLHFVAGFYKKMQVGIVEMQREDSTNLDDILRQYGITKKKIISA